MKIINGITVSNKLKDLTRQNFNKLTVLALSHIQKGTYWKCLCVCGNITIVRGNSLKDGAIKTCGKCPNEIEAIDEKTIGIVINSKKYGRYVAKIDKEDYGKIKNFRFCLKKDYTMKYKNKYYVVTTETLTFLHLLITNTKKQIDHINGDSLDNRKENLREATNQQNQFNKQKSKRPASSKYKGVYYSRRAKKWVAEITFDINSIYLGLFLVEEDAARAYNEAAIKYFGEFACLNIIDDENI